MMDSMTPRSKLVLPGKVPWALEHRWQEWQPALKLEQQARPSHLCFDEAWHRGWLLDLIAKRIEMRVVRRLQLDDPRQPLTELQRRVRMYLDKRQRRASNASQE
jgi:hypothetical protein